MDEIGTDFCIASLRLFACYFLFVSVWIPACPSLPFIAIFCPFRKIQTQCLFFVHNFYFLIRLDSKTEWNICDSAGTNFLCTLAHLMMLNKYLWT